MKIFRKTILLLSILCVLFSCNKDEDEIDGLISGTVINQELLDQANIDLAGYKIAFGDEFDIYMMNPDGSNYKKLTQEGDNSGYVSWSPNGQYIYFASVRGDNVDSEAWEAYRVNVNTKELTKISNFDLDVRSLGVSPDGQTLAISVMTGNSTINENLTQFSTNLYTIAMSTLENKLSVGNQIVLSDLTAIQSNPNEDQFWYEELNWNHDASNPLLSYTKTWRYDEDDVSYTHIYTIKPDGTENTLIINNKDQPIWSFDNQKLSFLELDYYDFSDNSIHQISVTGLSGEISGGSFSPNGNHYILFEIGDENRRAGIAKTNSNTNTGGQFGNTGIYEPRWSPVPIN